MNIFIIGSLSNRIKLNDINANFKLSINPMTFFGKYIRVRGSSIISCCWFSDTQRACGEEKVITEPAADAAPTETVAPCTVKVYSSFIGSSFTSSSLVCSILAVSCSGCCTSTH